MNTHLAGRRKVGERDTNTNFLCCPLRRGGMRGRREEKKERGRKNGGEQRRGKREE